MKNKLVLMVTLFVLVNLLSACTTINQIINPTPVPPPVGENDDWMIKVLSIKKYDEPKQFSCNNCEADEPEKGLSLQEKNSFIDVTVQIVNKSSKVKLVDDITLGLMLNTFVYGCGGVTVAGSDFCLPSGMIRNGNNYVNYGVDTDSFEKNLSFAPNSPEGEIVDFIFIITNYSKHTDFYFDNLSPLNIQKVKAQRITN